MQRVSRHHRLLVLGRLRDLNYLHNVSCPCWWLRSSSFINKSRASSKDRWRQRIRFISRVVIFFLAVIKTLHEPSLLTKHAPPRQPPLDDCRRINDSIISRALPRDTDCRRQRLQFDCNRRNSQRTVRVQMRQSEQRRGGHRGSKQEKARWKQQLQTDTNGLEYACRRWHRGNSYYYRAVGAAVGVGPTTYSSTYCL